MLIGEILTSLIMIFILIIPGIIFNKANIISVNQSDGVSSIVVNLTWPCLVIDAMQLEFDMQILKDSAYMLIVAVIVIAIVMLLAIPLTRVLKMPKRKQYITMFMMMFGNTGFIGLPVTKALYGSESVFYAAILEMINDVLIFTIGIMLIQMSAGKSIRMDPKQFLSPGLIGVLVGLVLFLANIQLPEILETPIELLGDATTPLTMFLIGYQLGGLKIKEIVGDWHVYLTCFLKLLIVPLIVVLILKLYVGDFTLLEKVLIISFAMPVGSASSLFSQKYKGEVAYATKSVLLSTLFSILTIPIFAIIVEM